MRPLSGRGGGSLFLLVVLALVAGLAAAGTLSEKGRKLAEDNDELDDNWLEEDVGVSVGGDDDDFFDFSFDDMDSFGDAGEDALFAEGEIPDCDDLLDAANGTDLAGNGTRCLEKPEVPRYPDRLLEQLVRQTWTDFQNNLIERGSLAGFAIDPFDVDRQGSQGCRQDR